MKVIGFCISISFAIFLFGSNTDDHSSIKHDPFKDKCEIFLDRTWGEKVARAAESIIDSQIVYEPSYVSIPYPNGDVDPKTGVCTDVIIRTYRKLNIDLQQLVHEDMENNFKVYPNNWNLSSTDTNIDHRRVPNLMTFFSRYGEMKSCTSEFENYKAGDIVIWDLGGGILHIGITSNNTADGSLRRKVIHNIGNGQIEEDVLFNWKLIGHYTY